MPDLTYANIHHYFPHPITGKTDTDDDGDPRIGWYFEIVDGEGAPLMEMMGPYHTAEDAEEACQHTWLIGDY